MGRIKRVLMTADTVGGVWTYAVELAKGLAGRGIEVVLATMGAPLTADQHEQLLGIPELRLAQSTFKLEWMPDPWADIEEAGRWLLDLDRAVSPDVVHLNQFCFGSLPFSVPALVTAHSCVCSWWLAVKGEEAPPEWNRYREEVSRGIRGAHVVVAPSRFMLRAVEEHYGNIDRGVVIYNGRARPEPAPSTEGKQSFIFSSGRLWDDAKNFTLLDRAARSVSWPVYVAGESINPSGATVQFAECFTLGRLTARQMSEWMERSSIYAAPALYEPFGLSILEAAMAGCALVLGDIPSLRELWDGAAVFAPPCDAEAFAAAIEWLIGDARERMRLGAAAHLRSGRFTPVRMLESYLSLYQNLA